LRNYLPCSLLLLLCLPVWAQWTAPPEPLEPWKTESLAWLAATHSDNLALTPNVQATSNAKPEFPSTGPAAAIDGNPHTEWAVDGPADLQLEFSAPVKISGVSLVRDIAAALPTESSRPAVFTIDVSTDGQKWQTVATSGKDGLRVTNWAALFPEREVRFVRLHVTRFPGRVGEFGVFHADLTQAKQWGWLAPECSYRTPVTPPLPMPSFGSALLVDLSMARGNVEGVVLPQSLKPASEKGLLTTIFYPADPQVPEVGLLLWGLPPLGGSPVPSPLTGPLWLYFNVGPKEDVQLRPSPAGRATLAVSTMWRNFVRTKPLALTVEVHASPDQPFQGAITYSLLPAHSSGADALALATEPLKLPAGGVDKHVTNFNLVQVAAGDYLLSAALLHGGQPVAGADLPIFIAPVPHPGMGFGLYGVTHYDGVRGQARGCWLAAQEGFTYISDQYWGSGYTFTADYGLRYGLQYNPCLEPIYNQNGLLAQDPASAVFKWNGQPTGSLNHVSFVYPEVVKRTEAQEEQWIRDLTAFPGFGGYLLTDDDVHLAVDGDYSPTARALFKQKTGQDVPQPSAASPSQPQDMPPPGLIADDQPWLLWTLFRCSDIRGNLPRLEERAKNRVDPTIKMGAVSGPMQYPFYFPEGGRYPPLFDFQYDAPSSYAYLYWVRQMADYICHGALAEMGNRGRGPWMLGDFSIWPTWILEQAPDGRWQLDLMNSLHAKNVPGNIYPPGALNKQIWCMLAGGFKRISMFHLPESGAFDDVQGTAVEPLLQTWGHRARAYGQLMTALQEPTRPVAILTSISTSAFETGGGLHHSGITSGVLKQCLHAHVPADMIAEEEILAGGLQGRKVLLLPDLQWLRTGVNAAIEKWAAAGGIVIGETGAPVQPAGSRAVKREEMAAAAGAAIKRDLECDNPLVVAREFDLDGVRYYYLVNLFTDRWSAGLANDPWVTGNNSAFTELYTPRAETAHLRLPAKQVWDVFNNRAYQADADGNIEVTVGPDDGLFLALYPQSPDKLTLRAPATVKPGAEVTLDLTLRTADNKPVTGGVPLQLTVTDPTGAESEYSQYALATKGAAQITFRTALNDRPGKWKVAVKSLVGNATAGAEVTVSRVEK
jgi:hypothetical protein